MEIRAKEFGMAEGDVELRYKVVIVKDPTDPTESSRVGRLFRVED